MPVSFVALAAVAAALAAAPQSGVKWEPLQGRQASQAVAQPAPSPAIAPSAPQAVIISPAAPNILRAGVEVPLRMEEGLDSNDKTVREGQQFRLSVAQSVMLGGTVVIPAGSMATGEITDLRRKGMWGKSGRIVARLLSVRVGDRLVRLSGSFDDKGTTGTAGVVAAVAFVPIAGFFMTGTSAKIPAGAGVRAFLDEDLMIAAPVPVVPAAVPASAPPTPH